ncbi:MAG TPA: protein kinase [Chthoniobacteraceae bacterium]|jgi:predicted Ser/Thr protein kinase|nr:protein kinase [Chthoniobacteraceae bacterium]
MNTPAPTPLCPKCGAPLPADAPEGLCPRCLASASLLGETVLPGEEAAPRAYVSIEEIAPHFPQLEILECLGRGGMGIVYKARQKTLNRFVALKLLAPERTHDAAFAERFAREAQALAALSHPGIVTIYDFGEAGRFFYLLMEYVDGVNLRQAMKAGRFTPEEALAIVPPVCEALQYAHEHGIVHRDIKPENLLLDKEGRVKIADFGIAKMLNADGSDVGVAETQPAGTPQYMAPEQKGHRRTDHRADIYSLGVVLYELLTGELPADKLQPPSRKVQIDVRLDGIVLRALEQTPELRYQTAGEFRTQVETVAGTPEPIPPARAETAAGSRFSRLAVVGACWAPLFFIFVLLYFTSYQGPPGLHHYGPTATQIFLRLTVLPLGLLAPFGTTILGWMAVAQIRRSGGKLYGLGLGVFDGLLFPLLVLDAVIGWFWVIVIKLMLSGSAMDTGRYLQSWNPDIVAHLIREWATVVTVVTALIVDFLIIRSVWRRVQSLARVRSAAPAADGIRSFSGVLGVACVAASGVLAWVWSDLPPPSPIPLRLSLAAAILGLLLALPARKNWLGKSVLATAAAIVFWLGICCFVTDARKSSSPRVAMPESLSSRLEVVRVGPPFVGDLDEGTVELIALAPHPSQGAAAWRADGSPATEPFPSDGGSSSAAGKVMREFALRIRSKTVPSAPRLNFDPAAGFIAMGSSTNVENADGTSFLHVQAIACPPGSKEVSFTVAVAEGPWQTVFVLRKPTRESAMAGEESSDAEGMWEAHLEFVETKGGEVALAFHYSSKPLYETRMAVIKNDGTVSALSGNGTQGAGGMLHGVASRSATEYADIREFHLQKRPCQYVGFRHVSLELGYPTTVEVASEARRPHTPAPAVQSAKDRQRYELEGRLRDALVAYLGRKNTKEQPGEEIKYRGMSVDLAPDRLTAEIVIDQPSPQSSAPHRVEWSRVRQARLIASQDTPGEWTITGKSAELGLLQFKVRTPEDAPPAPAAPPAGRKFGPTIERELTAPAHERKALAEFILPKARAEADFEEKRFRSGLTTPEVMQALRDRVKILEADLTGDPVKGVEAELEAARQQVLLATKKFESGLINGPDLEQLKGVEAAAAGRLRAVKANPAERCGINFETGELVALPAGFVLKTGDDSPEQLAALEWLLSHQVDAVVSFSRDGSLERGGLLGAKVLVIAAADEDWASMDEPALDLRIKERLSQWGMIPRVAELMTSGRLPATFLFHTHAGGMGVLQITGFSTLAHRIAFRYRMIAAPPHPPEGAASAPAVEEKKSVPAAPLPPPKITLLDIERHTRGAIEAWDAEGKALPNKIRWIVQPDVSLPDEGETREDRIHYCVSLLVENEPPYEIRHGSWSASFGDGVAAARLANINTPDGPTGIPYRISAEIPPDRKRIGIRFGIPIKDWAPVLVLQGPAWKGGVMGAPFDRQETPADLGARVSLVQGSFPQDERFGPPAGVPMTRLKLKLPVGVHYDWDWHVALFDAAGKEYEPDNGGGFRIGYTEFPLDEYDPNMLTADYNLPEKASIVKIVVNARSKERDYYWAEFKDLPLAGAQPESKSEPK